MNIKQILTLENSAEILRKPNEHISFEKSQEIQIFEQLEATLATTNGVGLAAPQIGINVQAFIIRKENKIERFLNPTVIDCKNPILFKNEGCLSIPGKTYNTIRMQEITITDDLHEGKITFKNLDAIIIQHEIDHLNAILVQDRHFELPEKRTIILPNKTGRNEQCPCGSGLKYKKCCLNRCGNRYVSKEKESK